MASILRKSPPLLFLYPGIESCPRTLRILRGRLPGSRIAATRRFSSAHPRAELDHLNPPPDDYSRSIFTDRCNLVLQAGGGGNGCVSFLREKFIPEGPPNGGDGGTGGNVYVQAVEEETSLHKIAHRRSFKAGNGRNGQGKGRGGQRGEDVLIQVPVGTVLREVSRVDPVEIAEEALDQEDAGEKPHDWVLPPNAMPADYANAEFPAYPRPRRSNLAALQPAAPIFLDLKEPMKEPMLLAAGAVGGLGNPHFATKSITRPKFATKGHRGIRLEIELELKILADIGLVGLPNAGKSTLLRALTRSRARVGNWAFTTLQPNIGTVVLDDHRGRTRFPTSMSQFTIADIPGIVPEAHLNRGLGLDFLRHIERARVLAFVVDLGKGDAVDTLKTLWRELEEFQAFKERQAKEIAQSEIVNWKAFGSATSENPQSYETPKAPRVQLPSMSSKPWFVIATKADLEASERSFVELQHFLNQISESKDLISKAATGWSGPVTAIPVSAIRGEGVERIIQHALSLL